MSNYIFREFYIPERMMGSLRRYIDEKIRPGNFLSAVIRNDLRDACGLADDENLTNLPAYVAYFYNEAPSICWGSQAKMVAWLTVGEEERNEKANKEDDENGRREKERL